MGNFDPDAFLASGSAAVATPTPSGFNPDAFLAQGASRPTSSFNPDTFLAATAPPPEPSTTPASDFVSRAIALAHTPSPQWLQPAEARARAFVEGAGVPASLKEVKDFVTRSPIQDVKDIYNDVTDVPEKLRNIGQTLSGSPAATVVRAPLSPEAFGVYGTAAGLLIPAAHEALKAPVKAAGTIPAPAEAPPVVGNEQFARVQPINEGAGAAVPADIPAPAQSTILESATQPEPKPVVPITEENAAQAATDIGGLKYGGVQSWPEGSGIPSTLEFTITEPGKETTLSVPPGITPEELAARRDAKIARFIAEQPTGEQNASSQPSTTGVSSGEVRGGVDEGTPLQQQGETASVQRQGTERGSEPQQTQEAPVGISKAAISEQRGARELPDIERQKQIDFGSANDQANRITANDPLAPTRLVDELAVKPRALNPEETPLVIRRVQETQAEFDRANKAVNDAATPEERTAAQDRLNAARQEYDKATVTAQNATSKTGAGLNSLKMLLNEDYTLAKMESRRRAANVGKSLTPEQIKETADLHTRIADLEQKIQNLEKAQATRQSFAKTISEGVKEARQAGREKRSLVDFLAEKEAKARERIIARRGRLNVGFDPTVLSDEIIIGASHIAKGLQEFGVWSDRMISDFGDRIRPMLKDIWARAKAYHNAAAKALRSPEEIQREAYKTRLAQKQIGLQAQLERGDLTKPTRAQLQVDRATFQMRANVQRLKNEFERKVATEAYQNKTPGQKFWDHFVGIERAFKLSGPEIAGKLGVAGVVREALAPVESYSGYAVSRMFPKLAKGTRYEASLGTVTKSEIKAKVAMFTKGIAEAAQNIAGKETELEAMGDKYGRGPNFWYNRIGKLHAAIKAPIKRAEFERSLTKGIDVAIRNGEDVSQPQVMARLANEAALDANRAIFQENTVVSKIFSMIEKTSPPAGRVARFLFPVVKIPVNLFKEFVNLHIGAPAAATRIGMTYWKGVETLEPLQREAIIRQFVKGSIGGAGLLWAYYNHDKVQAFFKSVPTWFQHTPMAMVINEGSYLWDLEHGGKAAQDASKELKYMAKTDIPFMYTITDAANALDQHNSNALLQWINNMTQSTVVPQLSTQIAKGMDKPGTFPSNMAQKPTYRVARNPVEAVELGIPGLRTNVPEHGPRHGGPRAPRR